jgi:hypothetical protein
MWSISVGVSRVEVVILPCMSSFYKVIGSKLNTYYKIHYFTVVSLSYLKSHENSVFCSGSNCAASLCISRNWCRIPSVVQTPLITLLFPLQCCGTLAFDSTNIVVIWLLLFLFIFQGRSRSLTHLDCLDPGELTSDVVMTTDTADRLIVPSTEPPRVRRQKLARSQVTNFTSLPSKHDC